MRVPLSWIDSFSPLPHISIEEIRRRFTLSACEVENIFACIDPAMSELWSQVQLVKVLHIEKHPNADKLFLPTIATGNGTIQLVCGADNLYVGLKTLWAPEGTEMCSGYDSQKFTLKSKDIMGIMSYGMLCSERELGISGEHEGIIDLSQFTTYDLGMSFAEILCSLLKPKQNLQLNGREISGIQFIFDIDNKSLTHRPDMWGIYGMAREFGAVFPQDNNLKYRFISYGTSSFLDTYNEAWLQQVQQLQQIQNNRETPVTLDISAESSCLSYGALAIDGIQVQESPPWLQQYLKLVGVNTINNVVDISNYVMLEMGIPNHIFDRDKLSGHKIYVYRLKEAQDFETLDGQQRLLQKGDTVVADESGPQAIAGIMGGQKSSVSSNTNRILLEVAVWNSYDIHQTSQRLGLRSDSSLRYEKSLDPYSIELSLWRLCQLIHKIHPEANILGNLKSYYHKPQKTICIQVSAARIGQILGYPLESAEGEQLVCQIFHNLGFHAEKTSEGLNVYLPSYRTSKDLSLEEDLVEEIGRIIGYEQIIAQAPIAAICPTALNSSQKLAREIRNFLVLNGKAQEVLSYPLIGTRLLEQAHWPYEESSLCLANPLNPEQDRLRPSLIPSHLELVRFNVHSNRLHQFCIFELGRSYHNQAYKNNEPEKEQVLPILQPEEQQYLLISGYHEQENPILELRNLCERLLGYLGILNHSTHKHAEDFWSNSWNIPQKANQAAGTSPAASFFPDFLPDNWEGVHPYERISFQNLHSERYPTLKEGWIFSIHPALLNELKLKGKLALACLPLGAPVLPQPQGATRVNKQVAVEFQPLQRFPSVEFDCTVIIPPKVLAAQAVHALKEGIREQYPRMSRLLQKVMIRSIYPVPGGSVDELSSYWLTIQCIFADRNGTLQKDEIKLLEERTIAILEKAGFALKMEHAQ